MPNTIDVYLEDALNNTYTLLTTNNYTFTADNNLSGVGRFYLRFQDNILNVNNSSLDTLNITSNHLQQTIEITGQLEKQTAFKLYDLHGRVILTKNLDFNSIKQIINVSHLNTGIYIVELETVYGNKRIQKLIIK